MDAKGHSTLWEDDGDANVLYCYEAEKTVDFNLSTSDEEPKVCPACGKKVRLVWEVRVETVME